MQYDSGLTVIEVGYAYVSPVVIKHKDSKIPFMMRLPVFFATPN